MRRGILLLLIYYIACCASGSPGAAQETSRRAYRVYVENNEQMQKLRKVGVEVIAERYGHYLDITCTRSEADEIAVYGLRLEEIQGEMPVPPGFHDYALTTAFLHEIAQNYPLITKLDSVGASLENRALWALKISDNPEVDEDEPCFLVEGCIHGNENHALEVCIYFIRYMVENYGVSGEVSAWVDNREVWVIPLVNPDGHERNQRGNSNGVDLNRNFGYFWGFAASSYGSAPFSEPETQAIRNFAAAIKPYGALAFHTSGRVILYPWAYIDNPIPPDNALFVETAGEMVDSMNVVDAQIQYQFRRSGVWYWHGGEHNDWMYSRYGMLSCTIEMMTSQSAPPSVRENEVVLPAFRVMLRRPDKCGVTGTINDAVTGEPVVATVKINEIVDDGVLPRQSEALYGRYVRLLTPGTYTMDVYAPGYVREIHQLTIAAGDPVIIQNLPMQRGGDLIYHASIIDDDQSGVSYGNGNGVMNSGETIEFAVTVANIGTDDAQHVYGKLSTASPYISIAADSVFWGDIEPAGTVTSLGYFIFAIDPAAFPGTEIPMQIDFFDEGNGHWITQFNNRIQGFYDIIETSSAGEWSHGFVIGAINEQDDWQFGEPNGKSNDPAAAFTQSFIWGNDLGGSGWNGAYQDDIHNYLQTRVIDCSGWSKIYLQFYRWLNIWAGDKAYISVNDVIVWSNNNSTLLDTSWSPQTVDISAEAGGKDSVVIRFGLQTNGSGTNGGWNIDDVLVNDELLLAVGDEGKNTRPTEYRLYQNFPNPFNSSTTITFDLHTQGHITLDIYNVLGQKVKTLLSASLHQGTYRVIWRGDNAACEEVGGGVYFVKLIGENMQISKKLLLLR